MRISIITVTYNSELFLKGCIQSVLSQTYEDIEYIIVDGQSTDATLDIIKSFEGIKYVSEPDMGIYDAINKGFKMASGELVGILNSDDFLADNDVIKRVADSFNEGNADVVYADICFVKPSDIGQIVRYYSSKKFHPSLFRYGFQPAHPTFYAKRELFEQHGYYRTDLRIAGDFELLLRFLLKNKVRYRYVSDVWVMMRPGGVSTSGLKSVIKLNKEIIKACKINGLYTNRFFVYSKYLIKWWGFVRK